MRRIWVFHILKFLFVSQSFLVGGGGPAHDYFPELDLCSVRLGLDARGGSRWHMRTFVQSADARHHIKNGQCVVLTSRSHYRGMTASRSSGSGVPGDWLPQGPAPRVKRCFHCPQAWRLCRQRFIKVLMTWCCGRTRRLLLWSSRWPVGPLTGLSDLPWVERVSSYSKVTAIRQEYNCGCPKYNPKIWRSYKLQ